MRIIQLCVVFVALGCAESGQTPTTESESAVAEAATTFPNHEHFAVFVNNHQHGESNGCTTSSFAKPPEGNVSFTAFMTCGFANSQSQVEWEYSHTDDAGDHYHVSRTVRVNGLVKSESAKEITYDGAEVLLFEDDIQRVIMRPLTDNEREELLAAEND